MILGMIGNLQALDPGSLAFKYKSTKQRLVPAVVLAP